MVPGHKSKLLYLNIFSFVAVLMILNLYSGNSGRVAVAQQQQADPVIRWLQSPDQEGKLHAAQAIGVQPTAERVRALLAEISTCSDRGLRKQLLEIAASVDAGNYSRELMEVFTEWRNGDLREAMRKALLRSSSPKVVDELVNSGSIIEDQRVVRDIARTLTRIANPGAVDRLLAGLESSNISIAAGCAAALATIGNREAIQGLVSVYPQADQERKMVLLEAISRVKNQEALPAVNQALSRADIDANLRQTLNRTLDMISNR